MWLVRSPLLMGICLLFRLAMARSVFRYFAHGWQRTDGSFEDSSISHWMWRSVVYGKDVLSFWASVLVPKVLNVQWIIKLDRTWSKQINEYKIIPDWSKNTPAWFSVRHRNCLSGLPTHTFASSISVTRSSTLLTLDSFYGSAEIKEHSSFSIRFPKAVRVHFKCRSIWTL